MTFVSTPVHFPYEIEEIPPTGLSVIKVDLKNNILLMAVPQV